jgi:hypothetical protein
MSDNASGQMCAMKLIDVFDERTLLAVYADREQCSRYHYELLTVYLTDTLQRAREAGGRIKPRVERSATLGV